MGVPQRGIVDFLKRDDADEFTFLSNAAVVEVAAADGAGQFKNEAGARRFHSGENLILEAIWLTLPFGFGFGSGAIDFNLVYEDDPGGVPVITPIQAIGSSSSKIFYPPTCCNVDFNIFVPTPNQDSADPGWSLSSNSLGAFNVSQVSLPAVLDATSFKVSTILQVRHTFVMRA